MRTGIDKQWDFIRSYVVKDRRLFLSLMADGGIYEFERSRRWRVRSVAVGQVAEFYKSIEAPPMERCVLRYARFAATMSSIAIPIAL